MSDWPVGLSTGCFGDIPLLDCIEHIRVSGFTVLEICATRAHLDYHDAGTVARAARALRTKHMESYSFHAPLDERFDITALEPDVRRAALDEIRLAAQAAACLGVRYFVLHPGPKMSGLPRHERLERMENASEALDQVACRCRELGLLLVLENMLPNLLSGYVRDLLWLLGSMRETDVGVCLDTGHALLSGDLTKAIGKLSGHLWMVHANDNRGVYDDHLPPGQGIIDWSAVLQQLAESGFHGTLIMEVAGGADPIRVLEQTRYSRLLLRELAPSLKG